jgi:glyoxylase-like metal-dependent hydrolase (beta-lactamase superfamily II)
VERDIEQQVDELIDTRPGKELLAHVYDDRAVEVTPGIFRSAGSTAAYMLVHDEGRIIVNTGLGYESVHHKRVFDEVHPGPTTHIITTQAHVDHVGGVGLFRDPATVYVAQANNPACQRDDARIQRLRFLTAQIWFDITGGAAKRIAAENPGVPMRQDTPTPDLMFDERHEISVGGLDVELIASPGETIDSLIVWLPATRTAVISNLLGPLFPHFPNLNTLRGDRYRFVEPWLDTYERLRQLRPERLVTGRHLPIEGVELIDASLRRLHGALDHVHRETLDGMNAGTDVFTLMRTVTLPPHLRVGEGYGKVSWGVRTIWETYMGWFHQRSSTDLYAQRPVEAMAELVDMLGEDVVCGRARMLLAAGRAVEAVHLAEAVLHRDGGSRAAAAVMADAHQHLLDTGGDVSFWESGWLRFQRDRWAGVDTD